MAETQNKKFLLSQIILVPNYSFHSKEMHEFIHKQRSYKCLKFLSETADLQKKRMEKAEVIQKLILFTSEISLLIFFTSESITS